MAKMRFRPGQKVTFVDKFKVKQVGTFKCYQMRPGLRGDVEYALVVANAFGDRPVNCLVTPSALKPVE